MSVSMASFASWYQRRGLRPLPAVARQKFPRVKWEPYQDVAPTATEVEAWWTQWPDANIALVLGSQSGLVVVDLDGGEAAERLLATHGITLPPGAPRVRTANGWHVYLRCTEPIADRIALFKSDVPKAQVDVRGKGIVIAPPSIHPSGHQYAWEVPLPAKADAPIPEAPAALLAALAAPPVQAREGTTGRSARDPLATSWVSDALGGVGEGQRNDMCARLAGYFLGKGLPEDVVTSILEGYGARCSPPMPSREVERTVHSVARRERATGTPAVHVGAVHIAAVMQRLQQDYEAGPVSFLETPLPELNHFLEGGLSPGELVYLGARPGVGKSALALMCAKHAAERGSGVLVVNAEMKNRVSGRRLLAQDSEISAGRLKRGEFTADELRAMRISMRRLSNLPLWFTDDAISLEQIEQVVGTMEEAGLGLIIVDYLQLLKASAGLRERRHQVEELSKGLKRLAHTYEVPVLALSSLARPANGGRPTLAHLRESGELEHDADIVLLLHRDEDDTSGATELTIAKARDGRLGSISLYFHGAIQTFKEAI